MTVLHRVSWLIMTVCICLCSVLKRYIPGKARTRPYYLEVALRLPARSTTEIYIEFDYVFLKWQEYPPDANHGFYIGAAIITALLPVARNYTGLPQDGSTMSSRYSYINSNNNFQKARTFLKYCEKPYFQNFNISTSTQLNVKLSVWADIHIQINTQVF